MSRLQKLIPPPMRRPPKPGHSNGNGSGNGAVAFKVGDAPGENGEGSPVTDDPGRRLADGAKDAPADLVGWIDERMGATSFLTAILIRKVPKGTNWFYTLGSATLFAFVVQALTGVFLAMYYTPSPVEAYASITHLTNDVFLGEFVRGMHKWGASVMVILVFVHMARTFFFGAYKYPREINWVIGVVLLILTMVMGFTGYLLPFDQRSYWATIVGVNINGTGPLVGPYLSDFLRAGPEFGATTLSRFYAIHMLLVPGAIIAMIGAHLYLVVKIGTTAPPWLRADRKPKESRSETVEALPNGSGDGRGSNGAAA
jgi:quinol---cytochrome c reductase cytochrome b subunit, bacillus type